MTRNNIPLLLVLFSLSHLALLSSAEEEESSQHHPRCPSFQCGKLGPIRFPFSNTTSPECGLYKVDCIDQNHPKIQLKNNSHWYQIDGISQANVVTINDEELRKYLSSPTPCQPFDESFGLPNPSPISNVSTNSSLTVFNCTRATEIHRDYFQPPVECGDYDILSTTNLSVSLGSWSRNCSIIELPRYHKFGPIEQVALTVVVSHECYACHFRGGQCRTNYENEFYCHDAPKVENKNNKKLMLGLGLASIGALVGVLIIIKLLCSTKKKPAIPFWKKNQDETHRTVEIFLRSYGPLQVRRYSYQEIKKMTKRFEEKLGQGGFGDVYKGKLDNGCLVAVKVLNQPKSDNCKDFINEVAAISGTSHVNVVTLLGFCFEGSKRALIYEFMPNGSLEKFVFGENSHKLDWEKHYQISLGIARGLEYLHRGCNNRIVHFDIKPHNILLDTDFVPKISDFGLAKICAKNVNAVSMEVPRGTIGYIAPEIVSRYFGEVSNKSDVYSYGMMILEMAGGRRNVNVRAVNSSEIYFPHWIYKRLELDEDLGLRKIFDEDERIKVRKMVIVSLWCIQTDPSKRPTMGKVIELLEGNLDSLQIPPKPFLSSPSRSPRAQSSGTS